MRKLFALIVAVVMFFVLWATITSSKPESLSTCYGTVPPSMTLRGLRLFNDVGEKVRVFTSPIPTGTVRDFVQTAMRIIGWWSKAFDDAVNGRPRSPYFEEQERTYAEVQQAHEDACNPCRASNPNVPSPGQPNVPVDRFTLPTAGALGAAFGATGSWARYHTGQDFQAAQGADVKAAMGGRVLYAGNAGDWAGNHVAILHGDGYTTMYSHLSAILVTAGSTVTGGQIVGRVGATGRAFGPHLHFEVYPPGVKYGDVYRAVDPMKWAPAGAYGGPAALPAMLAAQQQQTGRRVAEEAAARWFPPDQVSVAVAVAGAESGYRNVSGPTVGRGTMRGMWQINDGANPNLFRGRDWQDPVDNAWMAHEVWLQAGRSWSPWSTYGSGAYRKFLAGTLTGTPNTTSPAIPEDANPDGTICGLGGGVNALTGAVKVGTWNILYSNSTGQVAAGVRAVAAAGVAVAGFQEVSSGRMKATIQRALGSGWGMTQGNTAVPIVWDKTKVALVRQYRTEGIMGGGYHKWIQVGQFRTISGGQTFTMVNTHLLYRVESGGKASASRGRLNAYHTHIRNIVAVVKRESAGTQPVVATADWNSDYSAGTRNGLLTPLAAAGLVSNWQAGETPTHGSRTIDGGWGMNVRFTGQQVLPAHGSDHHPVILGLGGADGNPDATTDGISRGKIPGRALPLAGMSQDAQQVMRCTAVRFPRITTMGTYAGHLPSKDRAVDMMLSGVFPDYKGAEATGYGWRMAHWYQQNAAALGVSQVIYFGKIWTVQRGGEGWRTYRPIAGRGDSSMHLNHVHVSVYGHTGTALPGPACGI